MDYKEKVIALLNSQDLSNEQKEKLERIFPELAESEDERIRKWLKHIIGEWSYDDLFAKGFRKEDIIAWLEKQGEQNPADKIEPKFHEGDWVVRNGKTLQISHIDEVLDGTFHYWFTVGTWLSSAKMEDAHLWTVQDAKDGDVLCTYECDVPKIVFILKGTPKKHCALSYHCYYNIMYPHFESDSVKGCLAPNDEDVKPATKEQRAQLEKAMTNAGYTFDFEKIKLKKIEPKLADTEKGAKGNEREIPNSAWSEEDEKMLNDILMCGERHCYLDAGNIAWLVSLKERVQPQLKQE